MFVLCLPFLSIIRFSKSILTSRSQVGNAVPFDQRFRENILIPPLAADSATGFPVPFTRLGGNFGRNYLCPPTDKYITAVRINGDSHKIGITFSISNSNYIINGVMLALSVWNNYIPTENSDVE